MLAGGIVLVLLSVHTPVRTPVCRRPPWRRMRDQASRPGRARDVCGDGRLGRPVRARGPVPPDRVHRRVLVYDGDRARQAGRGIPGEPRGAGRSACRTCIGAGRPNARDNLAAPGRQRAGLARVTGGDAMRFQVMRDSRARSAAGHRFAGAVASRRAATAGALAAAACGLVVTACGSQSPPGAASPAGTTAACDDGLELAFSRQRRCLCRVCAESQYLQQRSSRRPGRRLPQIHQRQPHPVPHNRLARGDRADGRGDGHALPACAVDHVRCLALRGPATRRDTAARRFRLRGGRVRRSPSWKQRSLPRAIRTPSGEPAGRFGKCGRLRVAAWRPVLPAGLHVG